MLPTPTTMLPSMRKVFTGGATSAAVVVQIGAVEVGFERLRPQMLRAADAERVAARPQQAAEAARVVEAQHLARVEARCRRGRALRSGVSGGTMRRLPDMPRCRITEPARGVEQEVLGAPADVGRCADRAARARARGGRPAQARLAHVHACDTLAREVRGDAAPRRFDFWKLWHRKCDRPRRHDARRPRSL